MLNDLRHACRLSAAAPGWTAAAILSLSLGIATTTVMFSVIDAVLLNPFPYRAPDRLVLIWGSRDVGVTRGLSRPDIDDWRRLTRSFEDIDGYLGNLAFSLGPSESGRIPAACVGDRVLDILGVQPALGRNFTAAETRVGGDAVVLLSDELWRTRFDADPDIVTRAIALDGRPHDVVGVLPAWFFFPDTDARLWVPAPCGLSNYEQRGGMALHAVGRLRAGVRLEDAQRELDGASAHLAALYPATHANRTAGVFPMRRILVAEYERALWTLLGGMMLVLLIGSANAVHLQLARGLSREGELAVRAANGATRARLIRQLLTEAAVLAGAAAMAALGLAWIGLRLLQTLSLTQIPRLDQATLDARVLAFGLAMSIAAALASGAWPALRLSAVRPSEALKVGGAATPSRGSRAARDLLATGEIAAATVLVIAAALVVQSFLYLSRADWGFNPERLMLLEVRLPPELARDPQGRHELSAAIRDRLRVLPDVEAVSVSHTAPIRWGSWSPMPVLVDGRIMDGLGRWTIGPGYVATAGIRILEGREFADQDDQAAPRRVVISRAAARRLWPGQSPVGRTLALLGLRSDPAIRERLRSAPRSVTPSDFEIVGGQSWEVIGVVDDVRMFGLDVQGNSAIYVDARQVPSGWLGLNEIKVLLRTRTDSAPIVDTARDAIVGLRPDVTFTEVVSMSELVSHSIGGRGTNKLLVVVSAVFGTLGLCLAGLGIYGILSHTISLRLREIGIRMALGAGQRQVAWIVVGYSLRLLTAGLALGLVSAWAATRGMAALLSGVTPHDSSTYAAAAIALSLAVLLACLPATYRAVRLDPVALLRS